MYSEIMDGYATAKTYMNGQIYSLTNPKEFICAVKLFRSNNWIVLQIGVEDVKNIEDQATAFAVYDKSPINEERKMFIPVSQLKKANVWNEEKVKVDDDKIPMGLSTAQAKMVINRFTKYNDSLAFKLDVSDIMIKTSSENEISCPFK